MAIASFGTSAVIVLPAPIMALAPIFTGATRAVFEPIEAPSPIIVLNLSNPSFNSFLDWILDLRKSLSIPHTLKELIDDDSNFEKMSVMALNDPSTSSNPIKLNENDFLKLYQKSFEGTL